jgi:hypothetical protein
MGFGDVEAGQHVPTQASLAGGLAAPRGATDRLARQPVQQSGRAIWRTTMQLLRPEDDAKPVPRLGHQAQALPRSDALTPTALTSRSQPRPVRHVRRGRRFGVRAVVKHRCVITASVMCPSFVTESETWLRDVFRPKMQHGRPRRSLFSVAGTSAHQSISSLAGAPRPPAIKHAWAMLAQPRRRQVPCRALLSAA